MSNLFLKYCWRKLAATKIIELGHMELANRTAICNTNFQRLIDKPSECNISSIGCFAKLTNVRYPFMAMSFSYGGETFTPHTNGLVGQVLPAPVFFFCENESVAFTFRIRLLLNNSLK